MHRGRGQETGGEGRGCRCHGSDVRRRGANPPLPHARARARTQRHAHARAPPLSLRHTGGKGQTKGEGAGRPEGATAAAARHDGRGRGCFLSADAVEPLLSPRPLPPPPGPPSPQLSRVPAPPPHGALGARRAWGARRPGAGAGAGAGAGGWGPRRAAGLLARPPVSSPGPSARARQVSAAARGRGCQERTVERSDPRLTPSGDADRRSGPGLWGA